MICQDPQALLEFINNVFAKEKSQANFRCDGRGDRAADVVNKAMTHTQAQCPGLPWSVIQAAADDLINSDRAIEVGTVCQDYIFEINRTMLAQSASAAQGECSGEIDLGSCIQEILCQKVGSNSTYCESTPK